MSTPSGVTLVCEHKDIECWIRECRQHGCLIEAKRRMGLLNQQQPCPSCARLQAELDAAKRECTMRLAEVVNINAELAALRTRIEVAEKALIETEDALDEVQPPRGDYRQCNCVYSPNAASIMHCMRVRGHYGRHRDRDDHWPPSAAIDTAATQGGAKA